MQSSRLAYLVRRHYDRLSTAAEKAELMTLLRTDTNDAELDVLLAELMEEHLPGHEVPAGQQAAAFAQFRRQTRPAKVRHLWRWTAAAAVLAAVVTGGLLLRQPPAPVPQAIVADIAPATDKATLTLSDGSKVTLDSTGQLELQQPDAQVRQQGGLLEYAAEQTTGPVQYNTLSTPRGGTFRIVLPDGTKVWLNAASTLRYPTAFNKKSRQVDIAGEAYFEVAKLAEAPFRVAMPNGAAVDVLGTSFNIQAYADVKEMTTTLTAGAIRVSQGTQSVTLSPDEQAVVSNAAITVQQHVNTEPVLAWKNGLFHFDNAPFKEVMQQLSRWYDVDVAYMGAVPSRKFSGELQRNLSLLQIVEIMNENKMNVRLEEGRKLVVLP